MIYVDLNPIRADISKSLESSEYTSVKQRIDAIKSDKTLHDTIKLSSFIGSSLKKQGISFDLKDYLELADWTGRIKREDKRGSIAPDTPSILKKLQLDDDLWMETVNSYSKGFHCYIGPEKQLKSFVTRLTTFTVFLCL